MRDHRAALLTVLALLAAGGLCLAIRAGAAGGTAVLPVLGEQRSPPVRDTIAVLLLAPVGALVTALFRNLAGVRTFGSFAPTLLALSFVHTDPWIEALLLLCVTAVGISLRALLAGLRLLTVSRLSVVLVAVVLSLAVLVSYLDVRGLAPSAHGLLLPMVVLTMTIEHFHVSAEQDTPGAAFVTLAGTLAVAAVCAALFRVRLVETAVTRFPEVLLLVVAVLILVGRYRGYRLVELWRFRDLAENREGGAG
jgi:hypothetical protein